MKSQQINKLNNISSKNLKAHLPPTNTLVSNKNITGQVKPNLNSGSGIDSYSNNNNYNNSNNQNYNNLSKNGKVTPRINTVSTNLNYKCDYDNGSLKTQENSKKTESGYYNDSLESKKNPPAFNFVKENYNSGKNSFIKSSSNNNSKEKTIHQFVDENMKDYNIALQSLNNCNNNLIGSKGKLKSKTTNLSSNNLNSNGNKGTTKSNGFFTSSLDKNKAQNNSNNNLNCLNLNSRAFQKNISENTNSDLKLPINENLLLKNDVKIETETNDQVECNSNIDPKENTDSVKNNNFVNKNDFNSNQGII